MNRLIVLRNAAFAGFVVMAASMALLMAAGAPAVLVAFTASFTASILLLGVLIALRAEDVEVDYSKCVGCPLYAFCEKTGLRKIMPPLRYRGLRLRKIDYAAVSLPPITTMLYDAFFSQPPHLILWLLAISFTAMTMGFARGGSR